MSKNRIEHFVLFSLVIFYLYYISINVPILIGQPDAMAKFALVKSICLPDEVNVFEYNSHHHLRWGLWFTSLFFCKIFGASPVVSYLADLFPMILALKLF